MSTGLPASGQWPLVASPSPPAAAALPRAAAPTFEELYELTFELVYRTVRRLRVAPAAVDDVVQEVYLTAHRRLGTYDPGRASVRAWTYGIVANVVSDHRRRLRRKEGKHEPLGHGDDDGEERFSSDLPPPCELAERAEAVALLDRVLAGLAPEKREVLVLAHLEEMTVPEIAEALGQNVNTVYSRLRVARREFEDRMARLDASAPGGTER